MPHAAELLHAPGWRRPWRWLLVAMMAATSWLAFMPSPSQPDTLPHWDKLQHTAAFAALAVVAVLAGSAQRVWMRVALPLLAYGLFIEAVQTWLPSRDGDIVDLLADAGGIVLGLILVRWLRRRWPGSSPSA